MKLETVEVKAGFEVVQERFHFGTKRTFSRISIAGIEWFACEDPVRGDGAAETVAQWKVKGDSAIPYGSYKIAWTHSPKYRRNMLRLLDVPGYQGILVHSGNNEAHTEGCILPGKAIAPDWSGVVQSRAAVAEIEALLVPEIEAGIEVRWVVRRAKA